MNETHINRYVKCAYCGQQDDEFFLEYDTKFGFVCDVECLERILYKKGILLNWKEED